MLNKKYDVYNIKSVVINCFLILMFTAFPLFYTQQYENIKHDKFYLFLVLAGLLILFEIFILVYSLFKNINLQISTTDLAFIVLLIIFVVSTLCSNDIYESFIGNEGRFCALLSFMLFFVIYLIISRGFQYKEYVFIAFAVGMLVVYSLCILNSYRIDPMQVYNNYPECVIKDFTSTIGNKNVMSSLCCVSVPVFFVLFLHNKNIIMKMLYLITSGIGTFAMLRCDSSSGYLGFIAAFVVLTLFYSKKSQKPVAKKIFWILVCLYSLIFISAIVVFIYFTVVNTFSQLNGFMKFFRFNEKWGTHRGYIWIKSVEIFKDGGIKNWLVGCGPDRFYSAFSPFFDELNNRFGDAANNSAHNELLNYLVTTGLLGLTSYIVLIVSVVTRALKSAEKNYLALAFVLPVISYVAQSVVNVSTITVLPLFFIFIALSESISRKEVGCFINKEMYKNVV